MGGVISTEGNCVGLRETVSCGEKVKPFGVGAGVGGAINFSGSGGKLSANGGHFRNWVGGSLFGEATQNDFRLGLGGLKRVRGGGGGRSTQGGDGVVGGRVLVSNLSR